MPWKLPNINFNQASILFFSVSKLKNIIFHSVLSWEVQALVMTFFKTELTDFTIWIIFCFPQLGSKVRYNQIEESWLILRCLDETEGTGQFFNKFLISPLWVFCITNLGFQFLHSQMSPLQDYRHCAICESFLNRLLWASLKDFGPFQPFLSGIDIFSKLPLLNHDTTVEESFKYPLIDSNTIFNVSFYVLFCDILYRHRKSKSLPSEICRHCETSLSANTWLCSWLQLCGQNWQIELARILNNKLIDFCLWLNCFFFVIYKSVCHTVAF